MFRMVSFGTILDHFVPTAAQILQMVSFGPILDHFAPKPAQMLQMVSVGTILDHFVLMASDAPNDQFWYHLDHFVPNAVQMLQMVSVGIILDHFVPKAAQMLQMAFWDYYGPLRVQDRSDVPNGQFWCHVGLFWAQGRLDARRAQRSSGNPRRKQGPKITPNEMISPNGERETRSAARRTQDGSKGPK